MVQEIVGNFDGTGLRVGLVVARFNAVVTDRLEAGALDCLARHGVAPDDITVVRVPGAFEIPTAARMLLHVRHGTGAKDRSVPLTPRILALLRQYWKTHRHPLWRFPAPGRGGIGMATATEPMPRSSVQEAFRAALTLSGINKRASLHTLRHSYATHVLEAGVNRRLIQDSVGPNTPTTTALSTPLTVKADAMARDVLSGRMADL